jgi:hypothetical protein
MSKMGLNDSFGYLKHKLWPKEGLRIKLSIWLPTIKSWEFPWFTCMQVMCHVSLEISWQGLQLCFRPHLNRRFAQKIMGLQSRKSPNFGNFKIPNLGIMGQNDIWVQATWQGTYNTIRGEGSGFPQVRVVVSLVSSCLPVACPCTKRTPTMH